MTFIRNCHNLKHAPTLRDRTPTRAQAGAFITDFRPTLQVSRKLGKSQIAPWLPEFGFGFV